VRLPSKILVALVGLGGLALGAELLYRRVAEGKRVVLRSVPVKRGELVVTITAIGTVEPEDVVDVGAQVAGMVKSFGTDDQGKPIDYGSAVEEGTVLAMFDNSLYQADVASSSAQLEQARCGVKRVEADLKQLHAKLMQAERDWYRAKRIGPSDALAQTSYDGYEAAFEIAKANVTVGEASLTQSNASVTQAQAALDRVKRNLDYCTIKSPVKGVIIDRRVNIGQTVVANLNAPSLFLIAKDLKRMQVWVAVNEADIGSIHPDQPVTFTTDAFPGETFHGQVGKVRLNAAMTQNVVTYTVEIQTDNSNGRLLPYLTANVCFEVARHADVLLVPNAALRWTPPAGSIDPSALSERASHGAEVGHGTVWIPEGEFVRPVRVRVSGTDGTSTEVRGEGISEDVPVIVGEETPDAPAAAAPVTTNPLVPRLPTRSRGTRRGS
jgi:HlyD family secretion protein